LRFVKTVNGEPTLATSNQGAFSVDLPWQSGIRALTVEVEVQPPSVELSLNGMQWSSNRLQAK